MGLLSLTLRRPVNITLTNTFTLFLGRNIGRAPQSLSYNLNHPVTHHYFDPPIICSGNHSIIFCMTPQIIMRALNTLPVLLTLKHILVILINTLGNILRKPPLPRSMHRPWIPHSFTRTHIHLEDYMLTHICPSRLKYRFRFRHNIFHPHHPSVHLHQSHNLNQYTPFLVPTAPLPPPQLHRGVPIAHLLLKGGCQHPWQLMYSRSRK